VSEYIPVTHELRSLVAAVTGYAELLESRPDEEAVRLAAQRLGEATERLRTTLDEVLAVVEAFPAVAQRLRELR
jgi:signal transduction histidine kinase